MIDDELLVPFVTDVAYGILFFTGITLYVATEYSVFSIGFTSGAMLGYAINTASHMAGFSINTKAVDDDS